MCPNVQDQAQSADSTSPLWSRRASSDCRFPLQVRAWRGWLEFVDDRHAAKAKTRSAAAFWQKHQVALAFRQWHLQVQVAQEMKAKAAAIVGRLRSSTQVLKFYGNKAVAVSMTCLNALPILY